MEIIDELNKLLKDETFRDKLIYAKDKATFINQFFEAEITESVEREKDEKSVLGHLRRGVDKSLPLL